MTESAPVASLHWKKPAPSEAEREWLEGLLRQRVSPHLNLAIDSEGWTLRAQVATGRLHIDGTCTDLRGPRDPACGSWEPATEGFVAPLIEPLPTPGMSGAPYPVWRADDEGGRLGYDVLTLAWWMLARVEEVGRTDLDAHDRFPATASHAFRHGYLERPIVDEWFEILRQLVRRVWPGIPLVAQQPSMRVSHDVDDASRYAFSGPFGLLRTIAGDVLRRGEPRGLVRGPRIWLGSRRRLHRDDPSNTFDWIMDRSDEHGLTSAFYFICGRTDPARDTIYDTEDHRIRALMRHIHERGHEIGLHPSYGTYRAPELLAGEAARLRRVCAEEGIEQSGWGGRMHFLRWETPTTLHGWEQAGMTYDSTMSYAELPGFRCGTCHEYPAFDPVADRQLRLRIRPLVAMECTIMAPRYMGLGDGQAALDKFTQLKRACHSVDGCFTTLWHNTYLERPSHRDLYRALLAA